MNDTQMPSDEAQAIFEIALKEKEAKNLKRALELFDESVSKEPNRPAYRLHLAMTAMEMAKEKDVLLEIAFRHAQTVCRMAPQIWGHWFVFGEVCLHCYKFPEAIAAYEKAIELDPARGITWGLLGFAYSRNQQHDLALKACEKAVELEPDLGTPHFLLSTIYYDEKYWRPDKVAYHGERAFDAKHKAVYPIEAMWNSAHGYLHMGDYHKGFTYLEARLIPNQTNANNVLPLERYAGKALWRGEKCVRLLVQTEMGLGDSFIMMRYLPLIKEHFGCEVVFECHQSMIDFCRFNFPGITCAVYDHADPETFDYQIPALSLPLVFNTRKDSVPNAPYLKAEPLKIAEWAGRLSLHADCPTVGICWFSGRNSYSSDNHETSKRKTVPFDLIKPLLDIPGVNFISLQTERDAEFKNPGIRDFSDTAALISLCDIVISVDTAVANLAGAMGANLWLMDRFDHCWRWVDIPTPWFPTAKIYRCHKPREWLWVVDRIRDDLLKLSSKIAA